MHDGRGGGVTPGNPASTKLGSRLDIRVQNRAGFSCTGSLEVHLWRHLSSVDAENTPDPPGSVHQGLHVQRAGYKPAVGPGTHVPFTGSSPASAQG